MQVFSSISLALATLTLVSCASPQLAVESEPAEVEVQMGIPGQVKKRVGKTPLTIQGNELPRESFFLTLSSEKHKSVSVLIPETSFAKSAKVSVKMDPVDSGPQCLSPTESFQKIARGVAEAQSLIMAKQFDSAEKTLSNLSVEFSNVSVIFDLLGNTYFLKRDFEKALFAYRRSLALAPDNVATMRTVQQIEEIISARKGSR
jgi:tetratricopeptide (TPR) repeat protein